MNSWLIPSITGTLLGTVVLSISYAYIYYEEKCEYFKFFLWGWIFYVLRLSLMILSLSLGPNHLFTDLILFSAYLNSIFLYCGAQLLMETHTPKATKRSALVMVGLYLVLELFPLSDHVMTIIVFSLSGLLYIYTGITFLSYRRHTATIPTFLAGVFIIWGLHKLDYPLLHDSYAFAPYGYILATLCSILAAIGILLLYYKINRDQYLKNESRLKSLADLTKNEDKVNFLEEILRLSIAITDSADGFINLYNKSHDRSSIMIMSPTLSTIKEYGGSTFTFNLPGCTHNLLHEAEPVTVNLYTERCYAVDETGRCPLSRSLSVPVVEKQEVIGVVCVINKGRYYTDADARQIQLIGREAARILRQKAYEDELIQARRQAEESDRIKSAFLSNMSHELRTPLNGILGMATLLRCGVEDPEQNEYFDLLEKSGNDLLKIVDDLLDLSELNNDLFRLTESEFNLKQTLLTLIELHRRTIDTAKLSITCEYQRDSELVYGDKNRIIQVLENILSNAVKFSHEGRIEVRVSGDTPVLITVSDQGIGIPGEHIDHIKEDFYFAENTYTKTRCGTGLGLSIAYKIVRMMEGTLTIESREGAGTTVEIHLPLKPVQLDLLMRQPSGDAAPAPSGVGSSRRILIAEDEAINRLYLKTILRRRGHEVVTASNGEEAVDLMSENRFDVVLMDMSMPVLDGIQAAQIIRDRLKDATTPIIAVTAHSSMEDLRSYTRIGMNGCIPKPFKEAAVLKAIDESTAPAAVVE